MRMPTDMPKASSQNKGAKQAASETVDDMLSKAEKMRQNQDLTDRGRRTMEQLQEDARNLKEYAQEKMAHMSELMGDTADSARKKTSKAAGGAKSAMPDTDALSDSMVDSLKSASEKLSQEISDLGARIESVKARVGESMQNAGGRAAETWHQSSEAAKNLGEREYCMPLPTHRICARHVTFFAIPLLVMVLMYMFRRRYPKQWSASVDKMKQPRAMLSRDLPSGEELKGHASKAADNIQSKAEYAKQRASGLMDEARSQYENKKEQ